MKAGLSITQKNAVGRISGLVLINAMIFQEILAEHDSRVHPLQKILDQTNPSIAFCQHWKFILNDINYYPIFHVAREIVLNLPAKYAGTIEDLAKTAYEIVKNRAALRHDLMGRVYHRLLADAKYLATYYTSIPAAILLLKLALRADVWPIEWKDLKQVSQFRIADLACGTGTLLMAAADAITDNYVQECAAQKGDIDFIGLHRALVEETLSGYDVLPSAIHLTASTLALKAPQITFTKMRIFSLPHGGNHHRLGSIEFSADNKIQMGSDLFGSSSVIKQVAGEGSKNIPSADLPLLDLCVMNPPFTRSVGGNLLFGSVPENERKGMQKKLKAKIRANGMSADISAGLGAVFAAVVHPYIKNEGRMALVLPKGMLSGVSWNKTRYLFRQGYKLEYLIASHDPLRWNFSESTNLSEVLLVAKKTDQNDSGRVTAVNLWHNPTTSFNALAISHTLTQNNAPDIATGQGALELGLSNEKMGEAISIPWTYLKTYYSWMLPCAFAQSDLVRVAYHLFEGKVWIPGYGVVGNIRLAPLGTLGSFGPDRRNIHNGFILSNSRTTYPAFWSHDSTKVFTLAQSPNSYLSPRSKAKKNYPITKVESLWPRAGKVLIAERLWLNTQRLTAIRVSQRVLSNVWWPFSFNKNLNNIENEKALILWMNSTLGLIMSLAHRVETRGAWVKFKGGVLSQLPVLDLTVLKKGALNKLSAMYDKVAKETILSFPEMEHDRVRKKIDKAIADALGFPDFSNLSIILGQEPVICLRRL